MEFLVNAKDMKECDRRTILQIGIPSMVLMERAALSVVDELVKAEFDLTNILIVCGSGNNGGDGFAIARLLNERGYRVTIGFYGKESSLTEETALEKTICQNMHINMITDLPEAEYTTIVDALIGIGLSREISGAYRTLIQWINQQNASVAAVDIPSGVNSDTGHIMGIAVKADLTITFAMKKTGQILYPGADYCGTLVCREIGILQFESEQRIKVLDRSDLYRMPARQKHSNKGTYGKVLLIAGSEGMSGAACLAAEAACRTGCGLVKVFTPQCNRIIIQTKIPEVIASCYESGNYREGDLQKHLDWADAIAIGPGFGTDFLQKEMLQFVIDHTSKPLVIDADGLSLIAKNHISLVGYAGTVILTPHIGEMMRLTGKRKEVIMESIIKTAKEYALEQHVICVLKDARTVITDGKQTWINCSGNHGMSTGGSGDVLTGMITSLLAQGMEPTDAAALGVYLHGLAGDAAREEHSSYGMLAGDIIQYIGRVLKQIDDYA